MAKVKDLLCNGHRIKRDPQAAGVACLDCEIERLQTKVDDGSGYFQEHQADDGSPICATENLRQNSDKQNHKCPVYKSKGEILKPRGRRRLERKPNGS